MTISELIKYATLKFEAAGIDTPKLDALILLETALGKNRAYLIANSEKKISEKEHAVFEQLVARRNRREPVSQITGKKEFYGRNFRISKNVLAPRPETELVIEAALKHFPRKAELNILDLGTGSGCILLTLLAEFPNSSGTGIDKSKLALAIAAKNAYDLGIKTAVFVESDWCDKLDKRQKFNLIVSNPPYIPRHEQKTLADELGYEPEMALFGGDDGLDCYRRIADEISGAGFANIDFDCVILEIGINQEDDVRDIFEHRQMKHKETLTDLAGIKRTMVLTRN